MKLIGVFAALLIASPAWAQGFGLPPIGRPRPPAPPPPQPQQPPKLDFNWVESMDEAQKTGKPVVYYVIRDDNDKFVPAFRNDKVRTLGDSFVFVVQPLAKDNPLQQELKIASAPVWIGMDRYGNALDTLPAFPSAEQMHAWLSKVQQLAKNLAADIESKYAQAQQTLKRNQAAGIKKMIEMANLSRKGYPQIAEAARTLQILADENLARARLQLASPETEEDGKATLEALQKSFKGSPVAYQADFVLVDHLRSKGDIGGAWSRLDRLAKAPPAEREIAKRKQAEIVSEGVQRVRTALQEALDADWDSAKAKLREIRTAYAPTEVAKVAEEALADMEEK